MNFHNNLIINFYSVAVLCVLLFQSWKTLDRSNFAHKLYVAILMTSIVLLIFDVFGRFDGNPGTIYVFINHVGNFIIFLFNQVIPSLWLIYVCYQVYQEMKVVKKFVGVVIVINVLNTLLLILTQFYGLLYHIDDSNIYHRGVFYPVSLLFSVMLIFISSMLIVTNMQRLEKRYAYSLLFFSVPPLICVAFQIVFYGVSLMLNGVALSLLIVFLNMQTHSIFTDYLTGLYNRKKLEAYLRNKIGNSNENRTFAAIMLDINNFKIINDKYGHDTGDNVLRTTAKLLRGSLKPNDFIARFGGDEFFIVLDIYNADKLESVVEHLNRSIDEYNETNHLPYKLGFSMGCLIYDWSLQLKVEDFEKELDQLMYKDKQSNKELKHTL